MQVELLFFPACPHVEDARVQLRRAFAELRLKPDWSEVDVTSNGLPSAFAGYGSPTILVDGVDVANESTTLGASCRLYRGSEVAGVPSLATLVQAFTRASNRSRSSSIASFVIIPSALVSLLPIVSCAACWPAYAGVLASIGLPFMGDVSYLLPLTAGSLVVALVALAHGARQRRGFGPLSAGIIGAALTILGKFVFTVTTVGYLGPATLITAAVWNAWPRKKG